jgi:hypothetical protein
VDQQLYHGKNKLLFDEMINDVCFVLDQFTYLDSFSVAHWYKGLLEDMFLHIILIPSQPVFAFTP